MAWGETQALELREAALGKYTDALHGTPLTIAVDRDENDNGRE